MNLNKIAIIAFNISEKRKKNGAFNKNDDILKHLAGEVTETIEAYCAWKYKSQDPAEYAEELADVIICALIAAGRDGIDIETAIKYKMAKNKNRAEMRGDKL